MKQNTSQVVAEQIEAVKDADSLADTPFSKLFHEARTTGRNRATGVTLQVRARDGEVEAHDTPVKTRQGEHLRGTDSWDFMVSLPVKPFMDTRTARQEIVRQLDAWQQKAAAVEERKKERQRMKEVRN